MKRGKRNNRLVEKEKSTKHKTTVFCYFFKNKIESIDLFSLFVLLLYFFLTLHPPVLNKGSRPPFSSALYSGKINNSYRFPSLAMLYLHVWYLYTIIICR